MTQGTKRPNVTKDRQDYDERFLVTLYREYVLCGRDEITQDAIGRVREPLLMLLGREVTE